MNHRAPTRRRFLRTTAAVVAATAAPPLYAAPAQPQAHPQAQRVILINLVGGPSQLDTFDPKPNAPSDIRGPFRPIATRVPGVHVSELLPRLAARLDRVTLIRSVHHQEAPIHETGQQLVQTGRLATSGSAAPPVGELLGSRNPSGSLVVVPGPIVNTGVSINHGQPSPGQTSPLLPQYQRQMPTHERARYGDSDLGRGCWLARELAMADCSFVVVNSFDTVFDQPTWDCHADGASLGTTLADLGSVVAPAFDLAYATLLDDLEARGLLDTTLVLASGEFGRTPRLNRRGGRDHWPSVWTALLAGGGVAGGQVIGCSDAIGAEPADQPVHASSLAATLVWARGGSIAQWRTSHAIGQEARPLVECF